MSRANTERLDDIRDACTTLSGLTARGRDAFDQDPAVRLAMERLLEIIGESANLLDEATRSNYPTVPWRDITRLRILLAHHYHRVDPEQVWSIATDDVSYLATELGVPRP